MPVRETNPVQEAGRGVIRRHSGRGVIVKHSELLPGRGVILRHAGLCRVSASRV